MLIKRIAAVVMCTGVMSAVLTSCGKEIKLEESSKASNGSSSASSQGYSDILNFTEPEKGEQIIIMTIKGKGDVKIKLFPDLCPKAVENFVELAKQGYYDELIFHRIIKDFMIQGGDPKGNGTGGESIWGEKFDGGVSDKLCHAAGAVAYANSGSTATDGSQFYIVTGEVYSEDDLKSLELRGMKFTDEAKKIYSTVGGTPWLDGGYTVFGQVFDGLDIIFDVQNVETDSNDKPYESVVIESMKVAEYDGSGVKWYITDYN